jgi:hypothetical protein
MKIERRRAMSIAVDFSIIEAKLHASPRNKKNLKRLSFNRTFTT